MEAVLGLCEQGGAVLPPHKTFHALSAAAAAQEPAANIWIAPFSMPWSHCSQHLRVPVLHVQISLFFFTIYIFPCTQQIGFAIPSIWVSLSGSRQVGGLRGFIPSSLEDLTLHSFSFYLRLSGQDSVFQEGEEKAEARAGSKPQDGSLGSF